MRRGVMPRLERVRTPSKVAVHRKDGDVVQAEKAGTLRPIVSRWGKAWNSL